MNHKYLPIASLIITIIVIINEIGYLGKTNLVWVIMSLAVANGLNSINQLIAKK